MSSNLTRIVAPNGEIITILPITIRIDRVTKEMFAFDENKRIEYSINEIRQMADSGDPSAQCAMGDYYQADGYNMNLHETFKWYQKAAKQNHAKALWNLGSVYGIGAGIVEKDFDKSVALFEESAKYGFLEAMFYLGQTFMSNDIYDKAVYWLEKADKLGHPEAEKHLEAAKLLSECMDNPVLKETFSNISKEFWSNQS